MTFMEWSDQLSTNNPGIDGQHRQLVEAVNELHDAMEQGVDRKQLGTILKFLQIYTDLHFNLEEREMEQTDYPDKEMHLQMHRNFTSKVDQFVEDFNEETAEVSKELLEFLSEWLVEHILKVDKEMATHIKEKPQWDLTFEEDDGFL